MISPSEEIFVFLLVVCMSGSEIINSFNKNLLCFELPKVLIAEVGLGKQIFTARKRVRGSPGTGARRCAEWRNLVVFKFQMFTAQIYSLLPFHVAKSFALAATRQDM